MLQIGLSFGAVQKALVTVCGGLELIARMEVFLSALEETIKVSMSMM